MKLWQIVDQIHGAYGQRFQIPASRILRNVSLAQKMAFCKDCRAFEKRQFMEAVRLHYFITMEDGSRILTEAAEILATEQVHRDIAQVYDFPSDCRRVKEVLNERDIWIDEFTREIVVYNINNESLDIVYYRQPEELTCEREDDMNGIFRQGTRAEKEGLFTEEDEEKVILPEEWRWPIMVQLGTALCDTENYGDKTPQSVAEQYLREFWESMDTRRNDRKVTMSAGAW